MDVKRLTGIVADSAEELKSILRRLSYVGVKGSQEYVSKLFEHLAIHTLAKLPAGVHSPREILNKLNDLLEFQFEYEQILSALRRLELTGEVYVTGSERDNNVRFGLVSDSISNLWKEFKQQKEFEMKVLSDWLDDVEQRNSVLSPEERELLLSDLDAFALRLYSLHSIESVSLFFGDQETIRELLEKMVGDKLNNILPERTEKLNTIRNGEIPRFFLDASIERKKYIGQQLNSVFLLHMMQLDPQCAKLAKETITGGTLFLDTNVLYSLFGLNGIDLQESTERLLKLSRGLGYKPVVSPRTVEEYTYSVNRTKETFSNYPMVPTELAKAALSATYLDDIHTYFWQRSIDAKGYLSAAGFYEIFTNVDALLQHYDIPIDSSFDEYLRSQDGKIASEESFLQSSVPEKFSDPVVKHDAHMRLVILSLREGHEESSPLEVRYWLLTRDNLLVKYDRIARSNDQLKVPYCILTSHWMQLLRPYSAAVEGYEVTLAESLNSPLLRMFKLPQPEMIQEIITRMSQVDKVPSDIIIRSLADKTFINAFASERKEKEREELYQTRLASEVDRIDKEKQILADEVAKLNKAHTQITTELSTAIEQLKESALKQEELVETKNKLVDEINSIKSGEAQLTGKLDSLIEQLATTEQELKSTRDGKNELANFVKELTTLEKEKEEELLISKRKYEEETRQHTKFLEKIKADQARRQKNNWITYTWLISMLIMAVLRPWDLQGSWRWLTFILIVIPLILTQIILLYKKAIPVIYITLLVFINLMVLAYSFTRLLGFDLSNSFIYIVGAAEIIGVIFSILLQYQRPRQEKYVLETHEPSTDIQVSIPHNNTLVAKSIGNEVVAASPWEALGDEALKNQKYDAAIESYRKINASDKIKQVEKIKLQSTIEKLSQQAKKYESQGKWEEVFESYSELNELNPENPEWKRGYEHAEEEIWLSKTYNDATRFIKVGNLRAAEKTLSSIIRRRKQYKNSIKLLERVQRRGETHQRRVYLWRRYGKFVSLAIVMVVLLVSVLLVGLQSVLKSKKYVDQQNNLYLSQVSPTMTAQSSLPEEKYALKNDFDSGAQGWFVGDYANDVFDFSSQIKNGTLLFRMESRGSAFNKENLPEFKAKDFVASFEATITNFTGDGGIGFVFRKQENGDHYVIVFRADNSYGLYYYLAQKNEWKDIYSGAGSTKFQLKSNITNYFSIALKNSTIYVYANGLELATIEDETLLEEGEVGFAIELEAGQSMTVEFDNFSVIEN
jgi:hypothetical protein